MATEPPPSAPSSALAHGEPSESRSAPILPTNPAPSVFVTDPSVEAAKVEASLCARGYRVFDVPLALLPGRIRAQRPDILLVDIDSPGATTTVAQIRASMSSPPVPILFVGRSPDALGEEAHAVLLEGRFFVRPIDAAALASRADLLLGRPSLDGSTPAPRYALSTAQVIPPPNRSFHANQSSEPPPPSPLREVGSVMDAHGWNAKLTPRLAPDLERLLRDAETRVAGREEAIPFSGLPVGMLTPEEEVEAILPAEILAFLDEPIAVDDPDDSGHPEPLATSDPLAGPSSDPAVFTGGDHGEQLPSSAVPEPTPATANGHLRPTPPTRVLEAMPSRLETTYDQVQLTPAERGLEPQPGMAQPPPAQRAPRWLPPVANTPISIAEPAPDAPSTGPDATKAAQPNSALAGARSADLAEPPVQSLRNADHDASPPTQVLSSPDDAFRAFAGAVAARSTGALRFENAAGIRRIVLQDGDVVTAASAVDGESLVSFLASKGELPDDVARRVGARLPPFGRLAGAALIAHGYLQQDRLWDVLQAHVGWLLMRVSTIAEGRVSFEQELPARLKAEPPVFGGTPGPTIIVDVARRAVPAAEAIHRLGGLDARLAPGHRRGLLDECGLESRDEAFVNGALGVPLKEGVDALGEDGPATLYALVTLGVLEALAPARATEPPVDDVPDPLRDAELDDAAVRARIGARRALAEDGDYFAVLGVARDATGYDIRRAYLDLRRSLDPAAVLRVSLMDLREDLQLILSVLDEAYDVLKDPTRRERYRRAIGHGPDFRS